MVDSGSDVLERATTARRRSRLSLHYLAPGGSPRHAASFGKGRRDLHRRRLERVRRCARVQLVALRFVAARASRGTKFPRRIVRGDCTVRRPRGCGNELHEKFRRRPLAPAGASCSCRSRRNVPIAGVPCGTVVFGSRLVKFPTSIQVCDASNGRRLSTTLLNPDPRASVGASRRVSSSPALAFRAEAMANSAAGAARTRRQTRDPARRKLVRSALRSGRPVSVACDVRSSRACLRCGRWTKDSLALFPSPPTLWRSRHQDHVLCCSPPSRLSDEVWKPAIVGSGSCHIHRVRRWLSSRIHENPPGETVRPVANRPPPRHVRVPSAVAT